jgi:hypothetical protein
MRTTSAIAPLIAAALAGSVTLTMSDAVASGDETTRVSGSGVDLASEAIIHSEEDTASGKIRRLTEIVRLTGDLSGYVLYQPTQEFDFVKNTLVVTGTNFFSGTIAGSDPVVLRSDESRFEVDLATGEETGKVRLTRSNDSSDKGLWYDCDLAVVGTGLTAEGNPTFNYSGECTRRGRN